MSKVKQGQTFIDKVIHQTGSWENALQVAIENNLSITDDLEKGTVINTKIVTNKNVVRFFSKNDEPATSLTAAEKSNIEDLGIGKMVIGSSFVIR